MLYLQQARQLIICLQIFVTSKQSVTFMQHN